jgi:hypothetical protein
MNIKKQCKKFLTQRLCAQNDEACDFGGNRFLLYVDLILMLSFSDLTEQDTILDNSHFLIELQFNIPRECASISRQAFRCVSKNIFRI